MAKIVRNGLLYGSSDSADITYDNTSSGMTASTVQGAVDEVNTNVGDLTTLDTTDKTSAVGAINELNRNLSNKADKTMLSNRNLLDNPFFTVNSRGKTEYTGEVYTVDRWILQDVSGEAKLVVNSDNSLTITTVNNDGLKQVLNKLELNKTYTISFNDGTKIWTSTFVWEGTDIIKLYDDAVTVNYAIIAQENYDSIYPYVRYSTKANGKIVSVKLELGSVSTLANDVAPNYQEELIKCMTSTAYSTDTYANRVPNFAPNPNLLDNPWFTVNQRGNTSATNKGDYIADRWVVPNLGNGGIVTLENGILKLDSKTATVNVYIREYLEKEITTNLLGKTITISALFEDNSISSITGNFPSIIPSSDSISFCNMELNSQQKIYMKLFSTGISIFELFSKAGATQTIAVKAVKLELGSVSTLANDVAPNYAEEVMKCSCSTADANDTYANKPDYANLCSNFQDGVDTIYNSVVTAGATPTTKSPVDIATAISTLNSNLVTSTLLWTNPSPTSDFGAQTVSVNLSNYDGVLVELYEGKTVNKVVSRIYRKKSDSLSETFGGGYSGTVSGLGRSFTISDTGVTFTICKSGVNTMNSDLIPSKIYGIKGNLL